MRKAALPTSVAVGGLQGVLKLRKLPYWSTSAAARTEAICETTVAALRRAAWTSEATEQPFRDRNAS